MSPLLTEYITYIYVSYIEHEIDKANMDYLCSFPIVFLWIKRPILIDLA